MKAVAIVVLAVAFLACAVESKHAPQPLALQKRAPAEDIVLNLCGLTLTITGLVNGLVAGLVPALLKTVLDLLAGLLGPLLDIECFTQLVTDAITVLQKKCINKALAVAQAAIAKLCAEIGELTGSLGAVLECTLLDVACLTNALGGVVSSTGKTVAQIVALLLPILLVLVTSIVACLTGVVNTVLDLVLGNIFGLLECLL